MSRVGDHLVAVENTPQRHNMVVCTLCSCYPWEVLGLPPVWYKSAPYRSRAVKDPRGVLADFGVTLPKDTEIRVWDSTAETRFLVLPMRPAGTEGWSEERLADLVTRDSMIGTGCRQAPERGRLMDGVHDMGGMDGFGKVEPEPNEPVFHAPWEGRVLAMQRAMGYAGAWHIDMSRFAQERLPPHVYLAALVLPALGAGDGEQLWSSAARRRRRARGRPCAAAGQAAAAQADAGRRQRRHDARLVLPASRRRPPRFKPGDRVRDQEHPSDDAHAAAALRARPGRRGRAVCTAATCFRTRSRSTRATIRNGSTPWCSRAASCGAPDADPTLKISIDAFEPYLEPA